MDKKLIALFWSKVNKRGPTPEHAPELGPCWTWTSVPNAAGYGRLNYQDPIGDGRHLFAHRVAWFLAHGAIPQGSHVLHRCDRPSCVRESHLFLGSQLDNIADMRAKGRGRGLRHGIGERNNSASLSEDDVRAIRKQHAAGSSMTKLAAAFRTTRQNIGLIVKRKNWKHVA